MVSAVGILDIGVCCCRRGEVVEDVDSPLPPSTPLLLVKPPVGLATPAVFRALDLDARSKADPQQLLAGATPVPPMTSPAPSHLLSRTASGCLDSGPHTAGTAHHLRNVHAIREHGSSIVQGAPHL